VAVICASSRKARAEGGRKGWETLITRDRETTILVDSAGLDAVAEIDVRFSSTGIDLRVCASGIPNNIVELITRSTFD